MHLQAIIFDFDGTILDTETLWFEVCMWQYRKYGHVLQLEEYARCIGSSLAEFDPYRELSLRPGVTKTRAELQEEATGEYLHREAMLQDRIGLRACLERTAARGLHLAIASSSSRKHVQGNLDRLGLSAWFKIVCTKDDVKQVKPAPELFLLALEKLGCVPQSVLVIEDSPNGLKAALAAGIPCLLVCNPLTARLNFDHGALHQSNSFDYLFSLLA